MNRASLWGLLVGLVAMSSLPGCATPPPAHSALTNRQAVVPRPWIRTEDGLVGFRVEAPMLLEMETFNERESQALFRNLIVELVGKSATKERYSVSRLDGDGVNGGKLTAIPFVQNYRQTIQKVELEQHDTWHSFSTLILAGTRADGSWTMSRWIQFGRSLYRAEYVAPPSQSDKPSARRFIDSFQPQLSWTFVPFEPLNLSIWAPTSSMWAKTMVDTEQGKLPMFHFVMSNEPEWGYSIFQSAFEPNDSDEENWERLAGVVRAMASDDGAKGKVLDLQRAKIKGHVALQAILKQPKNQEWIRVLLVLVGKSMLTFMVTNEDYNLMKTPWVEPFFNTIRFH
jgi:hypothetical protein